MDFVSLYTNTASVVGKVTLRDWLTIVHRGRGYRLLLKDLIRHTIGGSLEHLNAEAQFRARSFDKKRRALALFPGFP